LCNRPNIGTGAGENPSPDGTLSNSCQVTAAILPFVFGFLERQNNHEFGNTKIEKVKKLES
jgi:hypothetical protein